MTERIWDYTALDWFLTCRRKYYWRMVRNLQTKTSSPALEFGKAIHSSLDTYYTDGLEKALKIFGESYKDREGDDLRTVANGIKLLKHYSEVYRYEPFKVLGKPEVGFVFPVGNILWGGRIDLPVEWDGQLYPLEHKTTSRLNTKYFQQFTPNMQITSYCTAIQEYYGRKCHGCVVNALEPWKEVQRKTSRTKKPEDHYARKPVSRNQKDIDEFKKLIQEIVDDITKCEKSGKFYPNQHACFQYDYSCPYKDLCVYGEDERFIQKDFIVEEWAPYKLKEEKENGKE